jgi:hypothetical protein
MIWEWRTETEGDCEPRIEPILTFAEVSMVGQAEHAASNSPSEKRWLKGMMRPYRE